MPTSFQVYSDTTHGSNSSLQGLNLVCIGHHSNLTHKILLLFWGFLIYYFCLVWRVERSGLHPEIVNESTEFIMLAITNTCFIYNALYIYTHIYINFYRYSEGEASIMCKNYFPICPSESTESNGINKAEVLKCQKGSA